MFKFLPYQIMQVRVNNWVEKNSCFGNYVRINCFVFFYDLQMVQ